MNKPPNAEPRRVASNEVAYSAGREEGIARLADVSISGALLEEATSQPPLDSILQLHVLRDGGEPVDLAARVVRHSPRGFAVKFSGYTRELAELLEEIEKANR